MNWFARGPAPLRETRFEALVRPHLERLYRLAWHFTRSREDAEDLVQTLLLKLLPQEERLAQLDLPGPWLARSLYHLYVDETRRRRRRDAGLGVDAGDEVLDFLVDEQGESPERHAERAQAGRALAAALERLSPEHRALLAWHDVEGYTLEELAVSLELPLGTLKSRLHRGRAHLRTLLMEPSGAGERVEKQRIAL